MLLITTALMLEARPLCAALGLRGQGSGPYPLFGGGQHLLVVTGTGPLRASAATAWAFGKHPGIRAALNIGFAGASPTVSQLHQWHVIHSIRDQASGRLHVPDILWKHPFPEATLLTVGKVLREDIGWAGLVDMEGSGFYEAARNFLSPDCIALLKWVSDPLSGTIDVQETTKVYEEAMGAAVAFIRNWPPQITDDPDEAEAELLREIHRRLRLTETQRRFLAKWIRGYLARNGDRKPVLDVLPDARPATKHLNSRYLEALKDVFKS